MPNTHALATTGRVIDATRIPGSWTPRGLAAVELAAFTVCLQPAVALPDRAPTDRFGSRRSRLAFELAA